MIMTLPEMESAQLRKADEKPEMVAAHLGQLDLLGRVPIPLRRMFKVSMDRLSLRMRSDQGVALRHCLLGGGQWYRPFDTLALASATDEMPGMLVTPLQEDILLPHIVDAYRSTTPRQNDWHPAFSTAALADPYHVFQTFAAIPFVLLVDKTKLRGRRVPREWADLLAPEWQSDIVFGGWRPNEQVPYRDFNSYLLLALYHEFGADGLRAFALNVHHLQHNVRTTVQAGTNSRDARAISILPWLHAEMCPRRNHTEVVWPSDGAIVMPLGYLQQPTREARTTAFVDLLTGPDWAQVLNRNCYPAAARDCASPLPMGARFKWLGWDYVYSHRFSRDTSRASDVFFAVWEGRHRELVACA